MNWTEILRQGGIPEPPGRDRALHPPSRYWRAVVRQKKNGVTQHKQLIALTYQKALLQCRTEFKDCTLISLIECEQF